MRTQTNSAINNKRIAFVITKSNWGGAQKYVFNKSMKAHSKGKEILVVLGGNGELKKRLENNGITVKSLKYLGRDISLFKEISVFFSLLKIFRNFKPHIIHLNSSKIGVLGSFAGRFHNLLLSKKNKAQIIFTAHGWAFNEDLKFFKKIFIKIFSFWTIILSHQVIVLSKFEYNQVYRWPFCQKKLKIESLRIGDIDFLTKEKAQKFFLDKIPQIKFSPEIKIVGTIAELHKNKGLKYAVEAFEEIIKNQNDNLIWIIIGEGEERQNLEERIKMAKLSDKIFLTGHIEDAAKYLKAFDLFLLPSLKEGLPYALLEAEKANLPIISTEVGGIPEFFSKKPNIIIKPKSVNEIIKSIKLMLLS